MNAGRLPLMEVILMPLRAELPACTCGEECPPVILLMTDDDEVVSVLRVSDN